MKLIVGHINPDFDALASMALAKLVHGPAQAVVLGGLDAQLESFVKLYEDELGLIGPDDIALSEVSELIVVDTSDPERIAPFDTLLGEVPVTLYDHHPRPERAIPAAHGVHRELGAAATILTLLLKAQDITIPPFLASLALLGIHDDTGNLSFELTQSEDHEACAHLLRSGASLDILEHFVGERLSEAHRKLFAKLLETAEAVTVAGCPVVIASFKQDDYVTGLAPLCNQLLDLYNAEAAFILARMEAKTLIIGRASGAFDVGGVLAQFGGGGHEGAGFARTDEALDSVGTKLLETLPDYANPTLNAEDIMSSPIKTVLETTSITEAQTLLIRYGHNGLPVLSEAGELVGVISRRNLDKAAQHKLGNAPVKAFMKKRVVTAPKSATLDELERLLFKNNIGRIPIREGNKLIGIVTRTDLIGARHKTLSSSPKGAGNPQKLLESLPHAASDAVIAATEVLEGGRLYVVGGTVRDALLGVSMQDLDLSLEGADVVAFAERLQTRLGGELDCHAEFGTCTLALENGLFVDIASARDEYYPQPGALPQVTAGTLQRDLSRRDFSINAIALRLSPEPTELIDPYGGLEDLQEKTLQTLHSLSFTEDPTRILRGARLAGRLGFHFSDEARSQIEAVLANKDLPNVSHARLRAELELTVSETRVTAALRCLEEVGALGAMFGFDVDEGLLGGLDELRLKTEVPDESYLLALLLSLPETALKPTLEAFHWPLRHAASIERLRMIRQMGNATPQQLARASEAELRLIETFSNALRARVFDYRASLTGPRLSGQDVLDLGLSPGPAVGEVLREIAEARYNKTVAHFDDELALAKQLVQARLSELES